MQPAPPCSAPLRGGRRKRLDYFSAGSCSLVCNLWVLFIYLFLPVMFPFEIPKVQTHQWEGFLVFGNFSSFMTPSLGWVSIPNSFVSIFIFCILSYLLSKTMGCLSGCLVSSTSVQKLFCGICSAFKWSFNEFVGEKVVFLSCSSIILEPTTLWKILKDIGIREHLTCLMRNLCAGQEATVITGHGTADWFQIGKGVH